MRGKTIAILIVLIIALATAHHPIGQGMADISQFDVKMGHLIENGKFSLGR